MAAKNGVATHPWHPDDPDHEKSRLEAAVDAATARAAAARQRAAERDAEVRAALRNELESSKRVLAEMDRAHEVTVALIREAALAEAERIVAQARVDAAGLPAVAITTEPVAAELEQVPDVD